MTIVPVMWTIWVLLALITACVYLYRSRLTKDEEGQIFLDEAFDNHKVVQTAIVSKVNRIQPVLKICMGLVGVATLFVIGYYIMDIMNQFQ